MASIHAETGVGCTVVLPALPVHHAPVFSRAWLSLSLSRTLILNQVHHAPVFSGVWPLRPMLGWLSGLWDEQKEALHDRARRVSFVRNAVDDADGPWSKRSNWAVDGIHPNDEGYKIWGEHIGRSIMRQALLS